MKCTRDQAVRYPHVDYMGQRHIILEYEWNGMRVREWPDGSMLIEVRNGRWRSYPAGHKLCRGIITGEAIAKLERDRLRRNKEGTHEAVTYYVDADGRIGVPPDPNLAPPDDVTVYQANTLADIDRLSRDMQQQMYNEFQDDGAATEFWDDRLGFDRQELVRATTDSPTSKGREIARQLLADVDREAADRQRITTRAMFHWREYDS